MSEHSSSKGAFQKLGKKIEKGFEHFGEQVEGLGAKMAGHKRSSRDETAEQQSSATAGTFGSPRERRSLDQHSQLSLAFAEREFRRSRLNKDIEKKKFNLKHREIEHDASKPYLRGWKEGGGWEDKEERKEKRRSSGSSKRHMREKQEKKIGEHLESHIGVKPDMEVLKRHEKLMGEIGHPPKLTRSKIMHDASKPVLKAEFEEERAPRRVEEYKREPALREETRHVPILGQEGRQGEFEHKRQLEGEQGRSAVSRDKGEVDDVEMLVAHLKVAREIHDEKIKLKHTSISHDASTPFIPKDYKLGGGGGERHHRHHHHHHHHKHVDAAH